MPARSKKQFKFMKLLENNPEIAKEHGMTSEQAAEFTSENKGKKSYKNLPLKAKKAALKKLSGK